MEIVELRAVEDDGDLGCVTGYYAEGFHDPKEFAIACNQEFDLASQESPVCVSEVKQGYLVKIQTHSGLFEVRSTLPDRPGAFAATYVFY